MRKAIGIMNYIHESLTNDEKRGKVQYICVYVLLCLVSLFMTIVNIATQKYMLMISTALFALLSLINVLLGLTGKKGLKIAAGLFSVEILVLLTFFIISGTPEGFSAIWICMLPTCGIPLFQRKIGTTLSALMYAAVVFLFWTPWGRAMLHYQYTESFMLRFPMLFIAFFLVSFFLETVRSNTYDKLTETEKKYEYLYCHDALTGLFNRYGFDERLEHLVTYPRCDTLTLFVLDVDNFKQINDEFGHANGDRVLVDLASYLEGFVKDRGYACRWGGEEFALLFYGCVNAEKVANELVRGISELSIRLESRVLRITASIGAVTALTKDKISSDALLKRADQCLYAAKDAGKNMTICESAEL